MPTDYPPVTQRREFAILGSVNGKHRPDDDLDYKGRSTAETSGPPSTARTTVDSPRAVIRPPVPKPAAPPGPAITATGARTDILESAPQESPPRGNDAADLPAWYRRPVGRLVIPGLLIAAMLTFTGVAGAYLVPRVAPKPAATAEAPAGTGQPSDDSGPAEAAQPEPSGSVPFSPLPGAGGRPADVLAAWAVPLAAKLGIPAIALQAYGYAELVATRSRPSCQLSWTTLAGIGKIESNHGRAQGAQLNPDGKSLPSIIGAPLDGQGGRKAIPDTEGGQLDTDRSWDRAVGPMQFIPSTWKQFAIDADGDGTADINDIDDAAVTAADYLCTGGRNLSTPAGWYAAVGAYNAVDVYIHDVYSATNDYGRRSRT
jgi:Transglycosylase SLT domain